MDFSRLGSLFRLGFLNGIQTGFLEEYYMGSSHSQGPFSYYLGDLRRDPSFRERPLRVISELVLYLLP